MARVGSYEIVRVIARGGMATVYEARQPALERSVALKRLDLRSDDPAMADRFIRESRIAARFDHPNIVTVFDFFECDGVPYIAMELLPRGSLRPWVGRVTLPQAFGVLEGVLAGLAHAEERGVAHRDLKPENVLVTRDGAVKIADFGIAKAYTEAAGALTATGVPLGTPAYMAPEQATGRPVGPRTDLYAVGAIAYELLSGAPPFGGGESPMAILYRQVNEPAPPLAGVDERIAAWVAWLLENPPEARPPGAASAWQALEDVVVGLLGPYWRRHAPLVDAEPRGAGGVAAVTVGGESSEGGGAAGELVPATAARPAATAVAARLAGDVKPPGRRPAWRSWPVAVGAAALVAVGVVAGVLAAGGSPPPGGAARRVAAAYDFDGNGRPSLVAGLPGWPRGGAVALPESGAVLTGTQLGAPGGRLGASLASADFDGDGRADLAVAGRRSIVVLRGAGRGLARRSALTLREGGAVAAADLDGDRRPDLVVAGRRSLRIVPGGPRGLRPAQTRTVALPRGPAATLAAGDVDRDGRPEIVAAGPHGIAVCTAVACRTLAATDAAAVAVGDVTGEGIGDVVAASPARGTLDVWRGGPGGPARTPRRLTQDSRGVPGHDQPGDDFGAALALADVDGDGTLDMLVGAPGEDDGAGRVTFIEGGAARGGIAYGQDVENVPGTKAAGHRFGAALAAWGTPGDTRLAVAAPGDRRAIVTLELQRTGLPGPGSATVAIRGAAKPARDADIRLGA